jgi:hypothetical protein
MTRLLLWLFPSAWRTRYGDELLDLVADTGLSPRVVIDIARAGIAERVRAVRGAIAGGVSMTFGPAWRHPTAWAVVGLIALLPIVFVLAVSLFPPYQIARAGLEDVANSLRSWLNTNRLADLIVLSLPAIAAFFAGVPLVRIGFTRIDGGSEASLSVRLRALNVVVVVAALGVGSVLVLHILFESVMQVGA